jgi:hypothetical protein
MLRKPSHQLSLYRSGELSLTADGDIELALRDELTRGLLGSTRAEIDGRIARVRITEAQATADLALDGAAALSAKEARYAQALPHATGRFQSIVDAYSYLVLDELRQLRRS